MRSKRFAKGRKYSDSSGQHDSLIRQWALRLLIDAQGYRLLVDKRNYFDDELLLSLGIELGDNDDEMTPARLLGILHQAAKHEVSTSKLPDSCLAQNLRLLGEALSISGIEQEILGFLVLKERDQRLNNLVELFSQRRWLGPQQLVTLLSVALNYPRNIISAAVSGESTLRRCGLIAAEDHHHGIELLNGLDDLLFFEEDGPAALFRNNTLRSEPSVLVPSDYEHVKPAIERMQRYLRRVASKGLSGVNVLIYGAPGTGKTELARVLASAMNLSLYEVKTTACNGRPMSGDHRLAAYQVSQHLLASDKNSIMLFDEVEDVFNDRISKQYKAWVNQILENNPRPSFWLTNSHDTIDPAYIRRFDLVLAMPELTAKSRLGIAQRVLADLPVRYEWLTQLAEKKTVQAAHLVQAAKVVKNSGYRKPERIEQEIDAILASLHQALGCKEENKPTLNDVPFYNPAFANTDVSLDKLTQALKRSGMGRICLHGAPGTGKSGYATYLAQQLGLPLIARKASDLLDMFVGGTEKALASAFAEAKEQRGILLIDEADSFLSPRSQAVRSWEVSHVNELLVQMEQYQGILLMSTNFMEHFDSAALRRFDFKIRFDYLKPDQAWQLFNEQLNRSGATADTLEEREQCRAALVKMHALTAGDFATVERSHRVMGDAMTAASLLMGLQKEHEIKTSGQARAIGFM